MMNIPYKDIIELRELMNEYANSDTNIFKRMTSGLLYKIQINSVIRPLIKSKKYVNNIIKKDLIDFFQFIYVSDLKKEKHIKLKILSYFNNINYKCNMYFDNGNTVCFNFWQDDDYGSFSIDYYEKEKDKTTSRTTYSINTAIDVGEEVYELMIDIITRYLKGEIE